MSLLSLNPNSLERVKVWNWSVRVISTKAVVHNLSSKFLHVYTNAVIYENKWIIHDVMKMILSIVFAYWWYLKINDY